MNQKAFVKRLLAVALSLIMVLGVMPMTAFALGEGDHTTKLFDGSTYKFSDGYDAEIWLYTTPFPTGIDIVCNKNTDDTKVFAVDYDKDKWQFAGWKTWFQNKLGTVSKENPNFDWNGTYYFSKVGAKGTKYNGTDESIQVNKEALYGGVFYLHAIFKPVFKVEIDSAFDTVNSSSFINLYVSEANYNTLKVADQVKTASYATTYGEGAYKIDPAFPPPYNTLKACYIANGADVTQNVGSAYNDTAMFFYVTEPTTVKISLYLPEIKVAYRGNGGTGTMQDQEFHFNQAQALTGNIFTRTGYTFTGWNTKADGSGTEYSDKENVTFLFTEDTTLTLYAQWKCTDHNYENGVCTKCGENCSHTGGTATCTEKATCSVCGMKYGDLGKHKHVYTASENIITETCDNNCGHNETATITAPAGELVYDGTEKNTTVSYSNDWQGGELTVTYSDGGNINAGKVTASIEKDGVKASVDYTIEKIVPNYTVPTGLTATYGQTLANIVLPEDWTWDDPTTSVGDAGTNSFKAIFTPADTTNYNTVIADVDVTVNKAVITITVDNKTAKQYEGLPQFTFTATGLIQGETLIADPTISTQADMKSAGTFEIIATGADAGDNYTITYVPGTLTVEAHTEHSGGVATCTEKAICTLCNQPYGETLSHTYSTDWKQDGTNHWRECSCGAKAEVAVHSGGTATCTDKAVCTVCGISYGERAAHTYENGKCTVCSEVDPNHVPETSSPQTGDDSNLWIWVALLFVSGSAVITLTVVDKKRRTVVNK